MTTAHRPTWHAAVGQQNEGGWQAGGALSEQLAARDLPAHKKLKYRQVGQGTANEVELLDLRAELETKERRRKDEKSYATAQDKLKRLEENKKLLLLGDAEADARESHLQSVASKYDDADDGGGDDSDASSDSDSDSDDDDDDEAELMRELENIKREREAERLRKEADERRVAEQASRDEILVGNPLLQGSTATAAAGGGSAKMKRRWNDDVVFKNQSRSEREVKKRFINDTIRNDFHRRFLSQYIQ